MADNSQLPAFRRVFLPDDATVSMEDVAYYALQQSLFLRYALDCWAARGKRPSDRSLPVVSARDLIIHAIKCGLTNNIFFDDGAGPSVDDEAALRAFVKENTDKISWSVVAGLGQ